MPSVIYKNANGTSSDIDAIERFERFLDDNHTEIPQSLHEQLIDFHAEIDDEVTEKIEELKQQIGDLEERILMLEQQLEDAE